MKVAIAGAGKVGKHVARDLVERRVAEAVLRRERAFLGLLKSIAVAANEARTVDEALQRALDDVCAYTGWPVGHVYIPGEGEFFAPTTLWHLEDEHLEAFRLTEAAGNPVAEAAVSALRSLDDLVGSEDADKSL